MSKQHYTYKNESREVFIDGEITSWWGTGLSRMRADVQGAGDVSIMLNSMGGDVTEGFAIADFLRIHGQKSKVSITGIGLVASIATIIHASGTPGERKMTENGFYMIHNPWTWVEGDAESLRNTADTLDTMQERIISAYVSVIAGNNKLINSSLEETRAQVIEWMKAEKTFSAQEALEIGLIDGITSPQEYITPENVSEYKAATAKMKSAPAAIMNKIKSIEAMADENKAVDEIIEPTEEQQRNFFKKFFGWAFKAPKAEANPSDNNEAKAMMTEDEKLQKAKEIAQKAGYTVQETETETETEMTEEEAIAFLESQGLTATKAQAAAKTALEKKEAELKAAQEEIARIKASKTVPAATPKTEPKGEEGVSREDRALNALMEEEGVPQFSKKMMNLFAKKF